MKPKFIVLLFLILSFSYSNAAKYKYWLVIQDSSFVYKDSKGTKYVYPQKDYTYKVKTNSNIQGSGVGTFTIKVTNGGKSGDTSTQFDVNENTPFSVQWNDIVDTCNVKIDNAVAFIPSDTLNPISPTRFSYRIASLKGQTPLIGISGNPLIGTKQTITAEIVTEATYPNLYKPYSILTGWVNIPAEYYEWTLPPNWKAAGQTGSTFILGADEQKSITITPDYVTAGEIKVRALNRLKTAGSDIKSNTLDRGFNFTAFPTSITFGDNTAKTFSTTLFSGITYEWSSPSGWQINGQGNTMEALNMNTVNVTPSFCSQIDDRVRVRLKKDGDVSSWYDCKSYQGFTKPSFTAGSSTIYQYEEATFTINNINMAGVQSSSCVDNKVCFNGNQGSNFKITFLQAGTYTIYVSMIMLGCSTPEQLPITITVLPHRIKLSGPSQLCDQATYTIDNLPNGATVVWSTSRHLSVTSGQSTAQTIISKQASSSAASVRADIAICNNTFYVTKTGIKVGTQAPIIKLYNSQGTAQIEPPYYTGTTYKIVAYGSGMASEPVANFEWTVGLPASCSDCFTSLYAGWSFPFTAEYVGNYNIQLKYYNASECGWSDEVSTNFYFYQGPTSFSIYPNPASDILTVKLDTESDVTLRSLSGTTSTTVEPYNVELWNERYGLVHSVVCNESVVNISLRNLPKGLYFVHLKNKGKPTLKKILRVE